MENAKVPSATVYKRVGFAVAAVCAAVVAVFACVTLLVPTDRLSDNVRADIKAMTGLDAVMRGDMSVSLFPSSVVTFNDVTLESGGGGASTLKADRIIARLRFFPLLFGRTEVADITLERPTINLVVGPDGAHDWSDLLAALGAGVRPPGTIAAGDGKPTFSELLLDDGTIVLHDEARGIDESLTNVNVSLAWPSIAKTFAATGRFNWRGEPVDASVTLSDFAAALDGKRFGMKMRLASAPLKLAFDGYVGALPTLKIDGNIATDSPSLRDAMYWVLRKPAPRGGFERFTLKSKVAATTNAVSFSGANIELDGNPAEGVLTVTADGDRHMVQGTLAADTLDLSPYVSAIRLISNDRDWDVSSIGLDGLMALDIDLRLSAAQVNIGGTKLGRTAIATNLRDGRLTVSVGESQAFNGVVQGSFGLAKTDAGANFKAQLQFANVNIDSCLGALFGLHRVDGTGTLGLTLEGTGDSVLDITRTLAGNATLTAKKGALVGVNLEQLLRRLERRPLSGTGDYRNGRTPYDTLDVNLDVAGGTITAQTAVVKGPAVAMALAGTASIPTRDLDLKGTARLTDVKADGSPAFELPFMVQGSWDGPLMLLDSQALIRRAPAAAPLLEAIRDRRTRDAVKSALDRLVGNPPAASPAAAQQTTAEPN
jgi:AsmA protein